MCVYLRWVSEGERESENESCGFSYLHLLLFDNLLHFGFGYSIMLSISHSIVCNSVFFLFFHFNSLMHFLNFEYMHSYLRDVRIMCSWKFVFYTFVVEMNAMRTRKQTLQYPIPFMKSNICNDASCITIFIIICIVSGS